MQNEGGIHFELPPEEPKTPEVQPGQQQEKQVERQHPAKQEAGVGKAAPQPGSTAVPDVSQIPQDSILIPSDDDEEPTPAKPVSPSTARLKAQDGDLIEKEWVQKAKSIVAKTRDDPHLQKSEMSKIKADYIQKRFKKVIKTDEAAA